MNQADEEWRSVQFRHNIIMKLENELQKFGSIRNKSGSEMECEMFKGAKSRDDYLGIIARVILHLRSLHPRSQQEIPHQSIQPQAVSQQGMPPQGMPMLQPVMGQPGMSQQAMQPESMPQQGRRTMNLSDEEWRSSQFRHTIIMKLEDQMQKYGRIGNSTSSEVENHIFMKAKTREEYLGYVVKLILAYRALSPQGMLPQSMPMQQGMDQPSMLQQEVSGVYSEIVNELQNVASAPENSEDE